MRCFVAGGCGFIGSHLCERLLDDGHIVYAYDDMSTGSMKNLEKVKKNSRFHFFGGSLLHFALDHDCDWLFHLAAKADIVPSIEEPKKYHETNVDMTVRLLEYAHKRKVKRFLYAASSSCYGIPTHYPTLETDPCAPQYPYALTKYVGELYVTHWNKVYKLPTISLRLFNVYGPRHRTSGAYGAVFGVFMSQLANQMPLTIVGDGTQSRDFTYVTDVVDAFVKAAESDKTGIYNVGSGGHYSVNRLADLLGPTTLVNIPKRPGEPEITFGSIGKIKEELGWAPKVSFEDGVSRMKRVIEDYKNAPLWTPKKIEEATKKWFEALA